MPQHLRWRKRSALDRRLSRRYPLQLKVRFAVCVGRTQVLAGEGTSLNLSSGGLLFQTAYRLSPGSYVVGSIDWPVLSGAGTPLSLIVAGRVVWSKGSLAAVMASRYELVSNQKEEGLSIPTLEASGGRLLQRPPGDEAARLILVLESEEVYVLTSTIMKRRPYLVLHVDDRSAASVLESGVAPVALVITNTLAPFAARGRTAPILYIPNPGESAPPADARRFPPLVTLERPILYGPLREWVLRLCDPSQASARRSSTNFGAPMPPPSVSGPIG